MINLYKVKKFCKDYTRIENYQEAVNDTTQTWVCHHILGEILSREQLLDHDFYYDVPSCMLKFVTEREHKQIHQNGKHLSEETRKKLSEAQKGNVNKKGKTSSIFGKAFKEHYRLTQCEDRKLYSKEYYFYKCNNKFSWEA